MGIAEVDAQGLRDEVLDVPGVNKLAARAILEHEPMQKCEAGGASVLRKPTRITHTTWAEPSKKNEVRYCSEALRRLASPGYGLAGRAAASTILLYENELPRYAIDASGPEKSIEDTT